MRRWTKWWGSALAGVVAVALVGGIAYGVSSARSGGSSGTTSASALAQTTQRSGTHDGRWRRLLFRRLSSADLTLTVHGQTVEVRLDRGVLASATGTDVVLREPDGATVTVPVSSSTRVRVNGQSSGLSALQPGMRLLAVRIDGRPARSVRAFSPGFRRSRSHGAARPGAGTGVGASASPSAAA